MSRSIVALRQDEYEEGQNFLRQKKLRQVNQLILMNNLKRGDQNISSTTLFNYFTKIFGNLYDDSIGVRFIGSEDSDHKRTELLNKLALNDYKEMGKALLDYDWLWDALFFGEAYVETLNFDKRRHIMMPEVINPLTLVFDPYFANPQQWRYYGKWILRSGYDIDLLIKRGIITGISSHRDLKEGIDAEIWDYKVKRELAKEGNPPPAETGKATGIYQIYETFCISQTGQKELQWIDKDFSTVLRRKVLQLDDGPEIIGPSGKVIGTETKWPIVKKQVFREPHSTLATSIPDIIEDKHRAISVLYNLMYMAAKDEANPIYAYDQDAVTDVTQLMQRQILQHIPLKKGSNASQAIAPLNTKPSASQSLLAFIGILKQESADVSGTSQANMPGQSKGKKSATQDAILQQIAEMSQSLQAKIMGFGEADFWSHWYQRYIKYSDQGDKKIIALTSVSGETFETIQLDNIKTKYPPRVEITSSKQAAFKERMDQQQLMQIYPIIQRSEQLQGKNELMFLKHVFLPKFIKDSSTVELVIPNSLDEIKAQEENDLLAKDHLPPIAELDDDELHLYVHMRAKRTPSTWAHIFAHEMQLAQKKKQQQMAEQQKAQSEQQQDGDNGQEEQDGQGKQKKSKPPQKPQDAVTPVKTQAGASMKQISPQ